MISQKDIECIIGKYFNKKHVLTDHQISSYNHLIDEILPNILNQIFPITVNDFNEKVQSIQLNLTKITTQTPYYVENNGSSKIMTPQILDLVMNLPEQNMHSCNREEFSDINQVELVDLLLV